MDKRQVLDHVRIDLDDARGANIAHLERLLGAVAAPVMVETHRDTIEPGFEEDFYRWQYGRGGIHRAGAGDFLVVAPYGDLEFKWGGRSNKGRKQFPLDGKRRF